MSLTVAQKTRKEGIGVKGLGNSTVDTKNPA